MYIREIPEQFREEIKAIMERNKSSLYMPIKDRQTLFNYYYRFIYTMRKGESVQGKIQQDITCGSCIGKVIAYFKNVVHEW
jgi:hypothetical protein